MIESSRRNDFVWADSWNYVWEFSKNIIMDIFHDRVSVCFNQDTGLDIFNLINK